MLLLVTPYLQSFFQFLILIVMGFTFSLVFILLTNYLIKTVIDLNEFDFSILIVNYKPEDTFIIDQNGAKVSWLNST